MLLLLALCLLGPAHGLFTATRNHLVNDGGAKSVPPIENTLLLGLRPPAGAPISVEAFTERLAEALERDACSMTVSGQTLSLLYYKVHCPRLGNRMGSRSRASWPELNATQTLLDEHGFALETREYVVEYKHPTAFRGAPPERQSTFSWHGNKAALDASIRRHLTRGQQRYAGAADRFADVVGARFLQNPAQWGLARIDMHYGFLSYEYTYNYTGQGVDVYVVDTGIRTTHQEFGGRARFLINTVGDGIDTDCSGHGTMVASLVGGAQYGAAKAVRLWAVKVLDCAGNGDTFTIIMGLNAVLEQVAASSRRAIVSMSLGGDATSTLDSAVVALTLANIPTAVAAGNEYSDACLFSPSRVAQTSSVITVAASTQQDTRPAWSNSGACVSLSAPGNQIAGADDTSDTSVVLMSGTSMATPFVSGVAALLLEQDRRLKPAQVKQLLQAWATPAVISGYGTSGGRNLLYSLIVVGQVAPSPEPAGPDPLNGPGGDVPERDESGGAFVLVPSFVLLLLPLLAALIG